MTGLVVVSLAAYALVELVTRGAVARRLWALALWGIALAGSVALGLVRLARPPRFALLGECHRCGDCCRTIVAGPPRLVRETVLLRAYVRYHELLHALRATGRGPSGEVIFSCGHLRADGRCGIHWRRPLLCRNYPVVPFFDEPTLLPGCSYRLAHRSAARMRPRASLPIVNPGVTVHHPTRERRGELGRAEDYEWVDDTPTS